MCVVKILIAGAPGLIDNARLLSEALAHMPQKPKVFLCASALGYYGERGDEVLTENRPRETVSSRK